MLSNNLAATVKLIMQNCVWQDKNSLTHIAYLHEKNFKIRKEIQIQYSRNN